MDSPDPKPAKFVWPPRQAEDLAPKPQDVWRRHSPRIERPGPGGSSLDLQDPRESWLHAIERAWLGVRRPPWVVRAAEAGWTPDATSAYCARCGSSVGSFETDAAGCPACRAGKVPWERAVRLGPYQGVLRDAVHEIKFTAWRRLGTELGRELGRQLRRALDATHRATQDAAIVPVPTSFWRRLSRGIDHTMVLACGVRDELGAPIAPLLRRRHRPSQLAMPVSRRKANVRGTMTSANADVEGRLLIILDDVRTTGATLREACRAVKAANPDAQLWIAVVGVTPDPARGVALDTAAIDTPAAEDLES